MLLLDSEGKEGVRLECYLPNNDFVAALMSGLGRIAFVQKEYADAGRWYGDLVAPFGNTHFAAEAMTLGDCIDQGSLCRSVFCRRRPTT